MDGLCGRHVHADVCLMFCNEAVHNIYLTEVTLVAMYMYHMISNLCICCVIIYEYADAVDIRLIGNGNEYEGIVEIKYQGVWGTICDDGWDDNDATVVCRELGFLNGVATQPLFPGPVWLRQVECLGNESKLSLCPHSGVGRVGNCTHGQDAGVKCSGVKGIVC